MEFGKASWHVVNLSERAIINMQSIREQKIIEKIFSIFLVFVIIKPIVDFTWNIKNLSQAFSFLNFQSVAALIMFLMSFLLLFAKNSKNITYIRLYVYSCFYFFFSALVHNYDLKFLFRYLTGVSALPILLILIENKYKIKPYHKTLFYLVLLSIILSMVFQISGIAPYYSYDDLLVGHRFEQIERLTGFYFHPLDLMRTLSWIILILTYSLIDKYNIGAVILMILIQAFVFKTTHRSTLVLFLLLLPFLSLMVRNLKLMIFFVLVTILSWSISAKINTTKFHYSVLDILAPSFFIKIKADGKVVENENVNKTILDTKVTNKNVSIAISNFRGRGDIWSNHIAFIKSFSFKEYLLGTNRKVPFNIEPEPHNQFIDWVERYGLIGTLLFMSLIITFIVKVPTMLIWKISAIMVVMLYSNITEIFVMPTFVWWMGAFLTLPLISEEYKKYSKL